MYSASGAGRSSRVQSRPTPRSYSPFFLRVAAEQRVAAGAGVGVDQAIRLVLRVHVAEDEHQHQVLEHVGVIAGMERVPVREHQAALPVRARNSSAMPTSRGPATIVNSSPAAIVPASRTARYQPHQALCTISLAA